MKNAFLENHVFTEYNLNTQYYCSGDRESVLARQEFIQQLSLWDQEETDTSKQVPIPGTLHTGTLDFSI